MADVDERGEEGDAQAGGGGRHRLRTILTWVGIGLVLVVAAAALILWLERKPIARNLIRHELESSGVRGSYKIGKLGLRKQELKDVVIGDPKHPDLTADRILLQTRVKLNGTVDVYRIVARGLRLRGKVLPSGRVSWGDIDKLLPPPSGKPFSLPDVAVDVANSSISLQTPWGPLGFAVKGSGNLTGGFKGNFVSSSPNLVTKTCSAANVRAAGAIDIKARHPHVVGPLSAQRVACPASNFSVVQPRLQVDARFGESFDSYNAKAKLMSKQLTAGVNGLAALNGTLTLQGTPKHADGHVDIAARQSHLASVRAERTRVQGRYRWSLSDGTLALSGGYSARNASLDPSLVNGLTGALMGASGTPVGPVATNIARAVARSARSFDVNGDIRLVNAPGGGAVRIENARATTATGGKVRLSNGAGVTYRWPSGRLALDGTVQMSGGGLPTGTLRLNSAASGGFSGYGQFQPYAVGSSRVAIDTLRFQAQPNGATRFAVSATVSGAFSSGRVDRLHVPVTGVIGADGSLRVGERCTTIGFAGLEVGAVQLGPTRLPICPAGPAILYRPPGGSVAFAAQIASPRLAGRIGGAPFHAIADRARFTGLKTFSVSGLHVSLGDPQAPVLLTAGTLSGSFSGPGVGGQLSNATAIIGDVPLAMSDIAGAWDLRGGELTIDGGLLVSDRADPPRFYPLRSNDVHFTLVNNQITATGTLRHPATGTKVMDVRVDHDLDSGSGHAALEVPGLTFGNGLQPEELTPLTEGVVALVQGTVRGHGDINWSGTGEVTSSGDFATRGMDLAAPFGPVEGLTTSVHFTDLLGLVTAPGQVATVNSINPGIIVTDGVIHYQILPDQLVKIERGEWPFMGGKLILQPTILNFGSNAAKRLTFELDGFDARQFIDSLGFQGLMITGTFDGVLPMIFDDNGGRIVGGRLDSRPPGGEFRYTGTKPKAGIVAGLAFDLLSDIKYGSMTVRLDGDLAGEFATRFTIRDIKLGDKGGFVAGIVRGAFRKVPLVVNLDINGPFRALISMAKGFKDPTPVIAPVMPFPLDAPGIATETRVLGKDEEQNRTTPIDEVDVSTKPPPPSEK